MKIQKPSIKDKIKGLEDELGFCRYKMQGMFPLDHWRIRELEIIEELKDLKRKEQSNVKATKVGFRKTIRRPKK